MITSDVRVKLAESIHENAVQKQFWKTDSNMDEKYMLIVTELSEAVEAHRDSRYADRGRFRDSLDGDNYKMVFEAYIKDRIEDELADAYIRCLDSLYKVNREYFQVLPVNIEWSDNFAENLLQITREACERQIGYTASHIESLCEFMEIDLIWHVEHKMKYNKFRKPRHGREY